MVISIIQPVRDPTLKQSPSFNFVLRKKKNNLANESIFNK